MTRAALAAVSLAIVLAACGPATQSTSSAQSSSTPAPSSSITPPGPATGGPCSRPVAARSAPPGPVLTAAALLRATIIVDATPHGYPVMCTVLASGATVHLGVSDEVEFIANSPPQVDPDNGIVSVSTRPAPAETPGIGGLPTTHVVVTLTGRQSAYPLWLSSPG